MNKPVRLAAGVVLLASLVFVGVQATRRKAPPEPAPPSPQPEPAMSVASAQALPAEMPAPEPTTPLTEIDRLLANGAAPKLPDDAPREVRFGAILFAYEGAELVGKGARSKQEAFEQAKALIPKAIDDFAEAAKHGDPGSSANLGTVPQGVLEPLAEYVLFTLEKRKVFPEPVDTPRGYWVVKRLP